MPTVEQSGSSVLERMGFALRIVRLLGSILAEAAVTLVRCALFPFQRRAVRARIHAIILGGDAPRTTARILCLFAAAVLAAPGCASSFPGASFGKQVHELGDSARELVAMDDAQESLESDLEDFGAGTDPREVVWDLEQMFLSPDAQKSLESDLEDLSDPELGALSETFEMLGW